MERLKHIYREMILFLTDIESLDLNMRKYGLSFILKMFGFEEMHHRILDKAKELEEALKKGNGTALDLAWKKSIAYFGSLNTKLCASQNDKRATLRIS